MPRTVLLVCTGNLCRSPMAEYLLRTTLGEHGRDAITIRSAGTYARTGDPMHPNALSVLADRDIDGSDFRATYLDEHAVEGVDVVIAMAREHRGAAVSLRPALVNSAFTLAELARICADVDPSELGDGPIDERLMTLVRVAATRRTNTLPDDPADDDLADPIGRPRAEYVVCADTITTLLDRVLRLFSP